MMAIPSMKYRQRAWLRFMREVSTLTFMLEKNHSHPAIAATIEKAPQAMNIKASI